MDRGNWATMSKRFFESDEDYHNRISQESDERTIAESAGSAPSQGFFESDQDYRNRISQEANECIIETSAGSAPAQGFFENDQDYRNRTSQEANERTIEKSSGSTPSQGFFESDQDYRSRINQEANEGTIQQFGGSAPSKRLFESRRDYRKRIHVEAREHKATTRTTSEKDHKSSWDYLDSSSSTRAPERRISVAKWFLLVFAVATLLSLWVAIANQKKATTPQPIIKTIILQGPQARIKAVDLDQFQGQGGWTIDFDGPDDVRIFVASRSNALNRGIYKLDDCILGYVSGEIDVFGPAGERVVMTLRPGTRSEKCPFESPDAASESQPLTKVVPLKGFGNKCRGPLGTRGTECRFVADFDMPVFEGGHVLELSGPFDARVFYESHESDKHHGIYPLNACLTNLNGKVFVFGPAGQRVQARRLARGSKEWQESLAACPSPQ